MPKIVIDEKFCKGCGICIELCPAQILKKAEKLSLMGAHPVVVSDESKCTACKICEIYCPDFAIYLITREEGQNNDPEDR